MDARTEAASYFDRFSEAFATFDGARVAALFAAPAIALRADGSRVSLPAAADVVRYYQGALDGYRADGCVAARWSELAVVPMGAAALLATVTWDLVRADGSLAGRWRQSYALSLAADGPKTVAAVSHAA